MNLFKENIINFVFTESTGVGESPAPKRSVVYPEDDTGKCSWLMVLVTVNEASFIGTQCAT